jgi:hypothetical protein
VTAIDSTAFDSCSEKTTIYCKRGSTADDKNLYPDTTKIKYSEFVPDDATEGEESEFVFDATTGTITSYTGTATDVVFPEKINGVTVKALGSDIFEYSIGSSITSVFIPKGVTEISYGFNFCYELT